MDFIEPCFGIGHNLSLICQMTSEDIKHQLIGRKTKQVYTATRDGIVKDTCLAEAIIMVLFGTNYSLCVSGPRCEHRTLIRYVPLVPLVGCITVATLEPHDERY